MISRSWPILILVKRTFKIGTRGSPLALAQTDIVRRGLERAHPGIAVETVVIATSGDRVLDRALAEVGGKGLFVKEIEEALLSGRIDLAVHSMKDVPSFLPQGLEIAAVLPRADARDILFSKSGGGIFDLAQGTVVGTSSPRRAAILLAHRPDLNIVLLRGNVGTRLEKFEKGAVGATLLAAAGLSRLGIERAEGRPLSPEEFLPAAGQGAVGIEVRGDDAPVKSLLAALNDHDTARCVAAERAFLCVMDGDCRSPLAAYATIRGEALHLRCFIARPDGSEFWARSHEGPALDIPAAQKLGEILGHAMKALVPADYLDGKKRA